MDTDQDQGVDAPETASTITPARSSGLHPIKALEDLFKRHIGQTTELAGHVEAGLGVASQAADLARGAASAAQDLMQAFKDFGARTDARFKEIEARLDAAETPIQAETAAAAEQMSKAVDDVKAAIPAGGVDGSA